MRSTTAALAVSILLAACNPAAPGGSGGSGGARAETVRQAASGGRGGNSGGGSGGSGGSSTGTGGSTSGGTGGAPATGGSSGSGGAGGSAGAGGSGGASAAGGSRRRVGGSGGSGGGSADGKPADSGSAGDTPGMPSGRPPKPSAGCGKMGPAAGERMITAGGNTTRYIVNLPMGYEANTPQPLGFAFHGFGNNVCTGECVGFRDMKAITVFPKSVGAGWEGNALANNIAVFEALVALMKTDYCVDENRIFVAGTSSGGQFTEHLACRFGDWLWQVSPVAAFVDNGSNNNCKGTPPALIIHGITDNAGMMGQNVAEMFAKRNGCAATPPAGLAMARTEMMAAFTARRAEHRCLDWDGCTANPVRYCLSSQITYSGLTHGWPRVGAQLITEFQATLKN